MCYSTEAKVMIGDPRTQVRFLYGTIRNMAKAKPQPMLQWGDIVLVQDPHWYTSIIRWRIMSEFDHAAIFTQGKLFDARGSGVKYRSLDLINGHQVMILRPKDQEKHGITAGALFIDRQEGKPYDWLGIFGFATNSDSADYGKRWYCFELCRGFLESMGYAFPRYDHPLGLTSSEFFILHPELTIIWEGIYK